MAPQLCGWGSEDVDTWRKQVARGVKVREAVLITVSSGFAFTPDCLETAEPVLDLRRAGTAPRCRWRRTAQPRTDQDGTAPPDPAFTPVGHVSLDWEDYLGEVELADRSKGILTLASFFILVSMQGSGLGK